jgi:UDP-N-acetyl-D-mannosaminuronate dehydrogenase
MLIVAASPARRSPSSVGPSRRTPVTVSCLVLLARGNADVAARESPAISIANHFLSEKARISLYDPQVTESQIWLDLTK